jgi:hypothetical protein
MGEVSTDHSVRALEYRRLIERISCDNIGTMPQVSCGRHSYAVETNRRRGHTDLTRSDLERGRDAGKS